MTRRKLTNNLNLPLPIVEAVANDLYSSGGSDFTATSLIDPPRIAELKRLHSGELEEDASDMIYSLLGQSVHQILERAGEKLKAQGYLVEHRFFTTYQVEGKDYRVSAQADIFHPETGLIQDYKVTSYHSVADGAKEEHVQQLNEIAQFARLNGFAPKTLQVVIIFRDWSKSRAHKDPNYPQKPIQVMTLPMWTPAEVDAWVVGRIKAQLAARVELPLCSEEDRWEKPAVWAVMKRGQKAAIRGGLCTSEHNANMVSQEKGSGHYVQHRPGEATRCLHYCPVAKFCDQWAKSPANPANKQVDVKEDEDGEYQAISGRRGQ